MMRMRSCRILLPDSGEGRAGSVGPCCHTDTRDITHLHRPPCPTQWKPNPVRYPTFIGDSLIAGDNFGEIADDFWRFAISHVDRCAGRTDTYERGENMRLRRWIVLVAVGPWMLLTSCLMRIDDGGDSTSFSAAKK